MLGIRRLGIVVVSTVLLAASLPTGTFAASSTADPARLAAPADVRAGTPAVTSAASAALDLDASSALASLAEARDPASHLPTMGGEAAPAGTAAIPLTVKGESASTVTARAHARATSQAAQSTAGPNVSSFAIQGTVHYSNGSVAGGITVFARLDATHSTTTVSNVSTGQYSILVNPGTYRVGAGYEGPVTNERYWYAGASMAPVSSLGSPIPVSSADVTGIDLVIPADLTISGTLKWGASAATSGTVDIYDLYGNLAAETSISGAGSFSVQVRPGKYLIAGINNTDPNFGSAWYGPGGYAVSSANATVITVSTANVTGITISLPRLQMVSGTAATTAGTPLGSVYVEAWVDGVYWRGIQTAPSGSYGILVAPGSVEVWFYDLYLNYAPGWWAGGYNVVPDWRNDTPFALTSSPATVNARLTAAHYISGHVTNGGSNVANILIAALQNGTTVSSSTTDGSGLYSIPVLPGTYKVHVPFDTNVVSGWYGSGGFVIDESAAGQVAVSTDATGIDLNIPAGKTVSGTVTNEDGVGLNAVAEAFHNGSLYALTYTSVPSGSYSLLLPPSSYQMAFADTLQTYGAGWYSTGGLVRNSSQATAVNPSGSPSNISVVLPYLTVPGKPTNVVAQGFSGGAVVTWSAPANDGGTNITRYTVTSTPGSKTCVTTTSPRCTVSGLANGTPYRFSVTATNLVGTGPASDLSASITPTPVPGPPNNVAAVAGNASATVSWAAPDVTGGSAITRYTVTSAPGGKTCTWNTGAGALTCKVTGLTNGVSYTFTVTATNGSGTGPASWPSAAVTPTPPATFHAMTPVRLLDTRSGNGLTGKLSANSPRTFQVTGRDGVPANAVAVTGNVTVVNSTSGWAVYLGPAAIAAPSTSTINFTTGQVAGNGLTVALSKTGTLSATYISSTGNKTDLVFDVTGYFTPDASGATYHPMTPARMLDTRSGNGLTGKLKANTPRTFAVAGRNGVPSNAVAVTGNVTAVGSSNGWAAYLGPAPLVSPSTSTVNFNAGQVAGNNLTVALSGTGTLSATFMSTAGSTTDLVFDVTGYYTADATGTSFMPLTPVRLLDTRYGNGLSGKLGAGSPRTFTVAGRGGVPSSAAGVTGNVTVVGETAGWAVYLGPAPVANPSTSTINFVLGDVKGNGLTVALSNTGTLSATYISNAGNTTDLVFDVTGYFIK